LFQAWDSKQQKKIDADDIMRMVNKLGIKINKNESQVLLKSADINGDGYLDIEEFIGLIHSDNEVLNIDLRSMKEAKEEVIATDKIQQGISNAYENKLDNQLRFFMQKNCQAIARDCLNEDTEKDGVRSYNVDKKKLKAILKHRVKLPEMLKNDQERIDRIIDEYVTENN